jgi:L-ribulose-5-phosphate 3-epimerase
MRRLTLHSGMSRDRRWLVKLLLGTSLCSVSSGFLASTDGKDQAKAPAASGAGRPATPFEISLAEWSFHRTLRGQQGPRMDHLDLARVARNDYGIEAIEYVNSFFRDKSTASPYLAELRKRANDEGVRSLLIMVDGEGELGASNPAARQRAVDNHRRWVDAAGALGCHSIRVNAFGEGTVDEQARQVADGLRRLTEYAACCDLNVVVENHGGHSSNGAWLASVMRLVDHPRCGLLPDFGNWDIGAKWGRASADQKGKVETYDRYLGVSEMMPFAKGVSAKSYDFDEQGNETEIDYAKMLRVVVSAGFHGHVGIEYEGNRLSEAEGVRATKNLLERVRRGL